MWESGAGEEEPSPSRKGQKTEIGSLDGLMVWLEDSWHEASRTL